MANMIYSDVTFYGNPNHIEEIYNAVKESFNDDQSCDAYTVLERIYGITSDKCGWITCLDEIISNEQEKMFSFQLENKWYPQTEIFDEICERYNNEVKYVYIGEQPGNEIFVNTDIDGRFYQDRYYIDWFEPDNIEADTYRLEKWDEVVEVIKSRFNEIDDDLLIVYNRNLSKVLNKLIKQEKDDNCFFKIYKYATKYN